MNPTTLLTLSALLGASALALLAVGLLLRARQHDRSAQLIDHTLLARSRQTTQADTSAGGHGNGWSRLLGYLASIGQRLDGGRIGKALLAPEDRLLLEQIRRNTTSGRAVFIGLRAVLALFFPAVVLIWFRPEGISGMLQLLAALAAGVLVPKIVLRGWAERVRKRTEDELPLLIDLLRLLQGVGFSMDQSLQLIAERFTQVMPVLGRELRDANTAYVHGRARDQSLRRLAESYGNDDLQSLVQMILQVHQHGGAIQEPLRQFGERLRDQRKTTMKERTGKLSVKMTVVMMLTLLPALMAVLGGPAIVSLARTMLKMQGP